MLSRAQNKYIRSLSQQKYRLEHKVFVAEGAKLAGEWLSSPGSLQLVVATEAWHAAHLQLLSRHPEAEICVVTEGELDSVSELRTPNQVLVVARMPEQPVLRPGKGWYLIADQVQDPGNLGTLIRIADWFGIAHMICTPGCADIYNSKVVQAGMGGHLRVNMYSADAVSFLEQCGLPVFAATLNGDDLYEQGRQKDGVLIIGNESKGISEQLRTLATKFVTIPRRGGAESLNAAVSAGILCSHLVS